MSILTDDACISLVNLGRYDEAIQTFDDIIDGPVPPEQYPKNDTASAWNYKGVALKAIGRNIEADAAFAKAKELVYKPEKFRPKKALPMLTDLMINLRNSRSGHSQP